MLQLTQAGVPQQNPGHAHIYYVTVLLLLMKHQNYAALLLQSLGQAPDFGACPFQKNYKKSLDPAPLHIEWMRCHS